MQYVLLCQQRLSPPEVQLLVRPSLQVLSAECKKLEGSPIAYDFETLGTDPTLKTTSIRALGLANDRGCLAIDFEGLAPQGRAWLFDWLLRQNLIAHNFLFDGAFLAKETGVIPPAWCDTYGLFKQLATEGWVGQSWSLKTAMKDVLGWPEVNTDDLYQWLKDNKLGKSQMALAPADILLKYCALDAAATWQLATYFHTFEEKFPVLFEYHRTDFMNELVLLIEQQLEGLPIDVPQLTGFGTELDQRIASKLQEFLTHPDVAPHVAEFNAQQVAEVVAAEPPQLKKDGGVTSRWLKWQEKVEAARQTMYFNTDSPHHLTHLFYNCLKLPVKRTTPKGEPSVDAKAIKMMGPLGQLLTEYRNLRDLRKFGTAIENVHVDGVLHPRLKAPGTVTGRLAAGEIE